MNGPAIVREGSEASRLPVVAEYGMALDRAWYVVEVELRSDDYVTTLVVEFYEDDGRGTDLFNSAIRAAYTALEVETKEMLEGQKRPRRRYFVVSNADNETSLCVDEEGLEEDWLNHFVVSASIVSCMPCPEGSEPGKAAPKSGKDPFGIGRFQKEAVRSSSLSFLPCTGARSAEAVPMASRKVPHGVGRLLAWAATRSSFSLSDVGVIDAYKACCKAMLTGYIGEASPGRLALSAAGWAVADREGLGEVVAFFDWEDDPCRVISGPAGDNIAQIYRHGRGFLPTSLVDLYYKAVPIGPRAFKSLISSAIEMSSSEPA